MFRSGAWSSYFVPAYLVPGYSGYGGAAYFDGDNDQDTAGAAAGGWEGQSGDQAQARDSYSAGPPAFSKPSTEAAPFGEPPVTIVFSDGRSPALIRNYALTRSTLFVLDQDSGGVPSSIPVSSINLDATAKVNRAAGIDFDLPAPAR